jgi:hypothetical protein
MCIAERRDTMAGTINNEAGYIKERGRFSTVTLRRFFIAVQSLPEFDTILICCCLLKNLVIT